MREAWAPVGRIHPPIVKVERLSNSPPGPPTKSSTPSNSAAVLSGSKPLNCGGRGPADAIETPFWYVPLAVGPRVPLLTATVPFVSLRRQ